MAAGVACRVRRDAKIYDSSIEEVSQALISSTTFTARLDPSERCLALLRLVFVFVVGRTRSRALGSNVLQFSARRKRWKEGGEHARQEEETGFRRQAKMVLFCNNTVVFSACDGYVLRGVK